MPLFNVVGLDSTVQSFISCLAILPWETQAYYEWALNAFQGMFPPGFVQPVISTDKDITPGNASASFLPGTVLILCVWHIEKNVLMQAKSHFADGGHAPFFLAASVRVM
ncbi:hypothetical protein PsorP6_006116 [Peronosclerospora sorghi]|uniref:Uncharacterized protein n=1 Tax=Peronosclerospora sorghi TaxID=230839 RepID=A0ACC0W696_9STRA|nr:hypothetical protein PsorP6_006116 [Peronosclerospora sorghi]